MNSPVTVLAVAALIACGISFARPTPAAQQELELDERVANLEKELVALRSEVAALRKAPAPAEAANATLQADLEEVVRWIRAQTLAGDALERALEDSRAKGFTAGINPESRNVLLGGLGAVASAAKQPLKLGVAPQPKPAAQAPKERAAQR